VIHEGSLNLCEIIGRERTSQISPGKFTLSRTQSHIIFLFLSCLATALAFRTFREEIPNGASVPDPCGSADGWPGVGHKYQYGSGERNPFGQAFANAGFVSEIQYFSINST